MLALFIMLYSNTEQSIQLAFCFAMSGYSTACELHKQLVSLSPQHSLGVGPLLLLPPNILLGLGLYYLSTL
jgi:hypothetical protein